MQLKVLSIMLCLSLTGCMGINKKFDCPLKGGVTCKSVSQVNDLVDQGTLPYKETDKKKPPSSCFLLQSKASKTGEPKTLNVWFAPNARGPENVTYRTLSLKLKENAS